MLCLLVLELCKYGDHFLIRTLTVIFYRPWRMNKCLRMSFGLRLLKQENWCGLSRDDELMHTLLLNYKFFLISPIYCSINDKICLLWLLALKLGKYSEAFLEQDIDGDLLSTLTDEQMFVDKFQFKAFHICLKCSLRIDWKYILWWNKYLLESA